MLNTSPINPAKPMPSCPVYEAEELVGKILSLLEYGIEDQRRLEAGKSIIKRTIWEWYDQLPDAYSSKEDLNTSKE